MTAPERTLNQRMDALTKANEIRSKRAQLKRDLKARRVKGLDILEDPPDWIATMKVFDLLASLPKLGRVKSNKIMTTTRMSPSKTIEGMSIRQKQELVHHLRSHGPRVAVR